VVGEGVEGQMASHSIGSTVESTSEGRGMKHTYPTHLPGPFRGQVDFCSVSDCLTLFPFGVVFGPGLFQLPE